jgi:hypothetical protein
VHCPYRPPGRIGASPTNSTANGPREGADEDPIERRPSPLRCEPGCREPTRYEEDQERAEHERPNKTSELMPDVHG